MTTRGALLVAAALIALALPGCVTLGYDFINQRATVSFDAKDIKEAISK